MAKKMLIDATHPEETRVVVVDGARVEEFDYESVTKVQIAGNIYLAKVTRVEPSLQAAFVEYGGNRHGFLAFAEVHPDYYQIPQADRDALIAAERAAQEAEAEEEDEDDDDVAETRSRSSRKGQRRRNDRSDPKGRRRRENGDRSKDDGQDRNGHDRKGQDRKSQDKLSLTPLAESAAAIPEGALTAVDAAGAAFWGAPDLSALPDAPPEAPADTQAEDSAEQPATPDLSDVTEIEIRTKDDTGAIVSETIAVPAAADAEAGAPSQAIAERAGSDASESITAPAPDETAEAADQADGDLSEDEQADQSDDDDSDADDDAEDSAEDGAEDSARSAKRAADGKDDVEEIGADDIREEIRPRRIRMRDYKIQEVIKKRQILLVQVVKEERGTKGAALTTYLSLAGRYCVLMPNTARGGGISRKITNAVDRKRLKALAQELEVPEGMGLIIRTAGANRTKAEINRDYEYLLRQWSSVRDLTLKSIAPSLIYEEGSLIKRTIRDLYNKDIDAVVVEGEEGYQEAKDYMQMLMPSHAKNVQAYRDAAPLFIRYQVESQMSGMLNPTVQLKSGGYIVIGVTEALVAIDVNSGRSTKEGSIEDTALKTNLEAAEEVARQLKLRDLAGLIVIDFIDMDEGRNNRAVEKRLKDKLKTDRARIQLGRISAFGLLEMSRQRLRPGLLEATTKCCPHCRGTGLVRSDESLALSILRAIEEEGVRGKTAIVKIAAPVPVANYLLNQKRARIAQIEERYGMQAMIEGDATIASSEFNIERVKHSAVSAADAPARAIQIETGFSPSGGDASDGDDSDERPKRARARDRDREQGDADGETQERSEPRRRRRRKRSEESAVEDAEVLEKDTADPEEAVAQETDADGDGDDDAAAKKRRGKRGGRRRRKKSEDGAEDGAQAAAPGEVADDEALEADVVDTPAPEAADPETTSLETTPAAAGDPAPQDDEGAPDAAADRSTATPPVASASAEPALTALAGGADPMDAAVSDAQPQADPSTASSVQAARLIAAATEAAVKEPEKPAKRRTGWWAFRRKA